MGRWILAALLGLLGGFLIYMESAMVAGVESIGSGFVAITFLGGWALSTFFIGRRAKGASHVMARGSLLGALLWRLMAGAGLILSGRAVVETTAGTAEAYTAGPYTAGAAIGGGLMAVLAGGVSFAMVFVCLVSFLIFWLVGRDRAEAGLDPTLVSCPRCAEKIQRAAKVCRHCGAEIVAATGT